MPQIKSQIKRMKRAKVQSFRNRQVKSSLKTYISTFDKALETKDLEGAKEAMHQAFKALDQATAKGIIHSNSAANKKARISKKLSALSKS